MQKTHFRKAFAEVRAREEERGRRLNTDALIDLTVATTQPPDFGVEYDTAVVMVGRLRRERPSVEGETRPRRLFWLEMLRRVDALMAPPRQLRLCEAVQKVLAYQRPSRWYVSHATARRWIQQQ